MLRIFSVSLLPVRWLRCLCHSCSPTTSAKSMANTVKSIQAGLEVMLIPCPGQEYLLGL